MTCVVQCGDRVVAREQVLDNAARGASALASLGVGWGDTVAVLLRNDLAFIEAMLACDQLGAYSTAVNWHFTPEEVEYIVTDCGAKVLIAHADLLRRVRAALPPDIKLVAVPTAPDIQRAYRLAPQECSVPAGMLSWWEWIAAHEPWTQPSPTSPGSIIYTSGTTGRPKGVKRKPMNAAERERLLKSRMYIQGTSEGMRALLASPLYHAGPNATCRNAFALASYLNVMPRFDAEEMLRIIQDHRITHVNLVPIMLVRLLALPDEVKAKYDLSSLRSCIHGAGPCPPETKRRMIEWWGPIISETYGSTEVGLVTRCSSEEWLKYPGTVGKPVPGVSIRVYDEEGRLLPPGQDGELYVRNDNQPDFTYIGNDEARRAAERDGHISNGDIGHLNEEGYLFITDRKRDMIISGGVNIYPAEIEAVLLQCPGVRDCAVFGIPDAEFGEAVAAAVEVEAEDPADEQRIRAFLLDRIAKYKIPKVIEFIDKMPREGMGKIFKNKLRQKYWKDSERRI